MLNKALYLRVPKSAQNAQLDKTKFSKRHFSMETDIEFIMEENGP